MFSSVSACTPDSQITVSFTSDRAQYFNIDPTVEILINGSTVESRPILLANCDVVSASITTPPNYLGYNFYEYSLGGKKHSFAVVNKNNYNPSVKSGDRAKRWFNYSPSKFLVSWYRTWVQRPFGSGRNFIDINNCHIALDHLNNAVLFYSVAQELISRVELPAGPVEYHKFNYVDSLNQQVTEALVICSDKRLYRIRFDNQYSASGEFTPTVIGINITDKLWFDQDLANGASFIEANRRLRSLKTNAAMTALDVNDSSVIWAAGYDKVYLINKNFQVTREYEIPGATILHIACRNNDAIVTTRDAKVYYIDTLLDEIKFLYQTTVLGAPSSINNNQSVAIPDPDNGRVLIFGSSENFSSFETPGMAPAYCREFEGKLWITGHDTNKVYKAINYSGNLEQYEFDQKVTIVSVLGDSILGIHYLQEFVTLDLDGIQKVLRFDLKTVKGPRSHIGHEPIKLVMLGQENVRPIAGPGVTCWINGQDGHEAVTGDYFGVSYRAEARGFFRSCFVFGEDAFDYDVEAFPSSKITDNFEPVYTARHRLSANLATVVETPTIGNVDSGTTPIYFGDNFKWNMYGDVYDIINVSTNGYLTFGIDLEIDPNYDFGNLNVNAIYVEPRDLYQARYITNVDPLDVGLKNQDDYNIPSVSYEFGQIQDFDYLKIRWAGTRFWPYPEGNTLFLTTSITSWKEFPVYAEDFDKANEPGYLNGILGVTSPGVLLDYVSGGSISRSTFVALKYKSNVHAVTVWGVNSDESKLLVFKPDVDFDEFKKYSTIKHDDTGEVTFFSRIAANSIFRDTEPQGDRGLAIRGNLLIMDGIVSSLVNTDYVVRLPTYSPTLNSTIYRNVTNITSYQTYDRIITVLRVIDTYRIFVSFDDYYSVEVNQLILPDIFSNLFPTGTTITDKTFTSGRYRLTLSQEHDFVELDTFRVQYTEITRDENWPLVVPDGVQLNETIGFDLCFIETTTDPSVITEGNVTIQGNFIVVSDENTISSDDELLFKTNFNSPAYTYEIGMFTGRGYQYLQIWYDNNNHEANSNVGISSTDSTILSNVVNVVTNKSIVFASEIAAGNWEYLGIGSFNPGYDSFSPLSPRTVESVPRFDDESRLEFMVEQKMPTNRDILISTTFGYLHVNDGAYSGKKSLEEYDGVSLTAPFNTSLRTIAPIISIGDVQFPFPMISDSAVTKFTEKTELNINVDKNSLVSGTVTVDVSDTYYISEYYRSTKNFGRDIRFELVRNGTSTDLPTGEWYDLFAGDVINVYDVLTSKAIYDKRDVLIVGTINVLRVAWQTTSGPLFDYINFGTLVDPLVDYDTAVFDKMFMGFPDKGSNYGIDPDLEYETGNKTITSSNLETDVFIDDDPKNFDRDLSGSAALTGSLYIDTPGVNFVTGTVVLGGNGVPFYNYTDQGNYLDFVSTGSIVQLKRKIHNYFQSNVIVYQLKQDPDILNSNIYIPIGHWDIKNKEISEPLHVKPSSVKSDPVLPELYNIINANTEQIQPELVSTTSWMYANLDFESELLKNTIMTFDINSYVVLGNTTYANSNVYVSSRFVPYSYAESDRVFAPLPSDFTVITYGDLVGDHLTGPTAANVIGSTGTLIPFTEMTLGGSTGYLPTPFTMFSGNTIEGNLEPMISVFTPGAYQGNLESPISVIESDAIIGNLEAKISESEVGAYQGELELPISVSESDPIEGNKEKIFSSFDIDIYEFERDATTTEDLIEATDYERESVTTEYVHHYEYEKESITTEEYIDIYEFERDATTTEDLIEATDYERESVTTEYVHHYEYEKESTTTEDLIEATDYERESVTTEYVHHYEYEKESTTTEEHIDIYEFERDATTTEELADIFDYEKESTTTEELADIFDYEKESTTTEEHVDHYEFEKDETTTEELADIFDYEKESTTTEEQIDIYDYEKELTTTEELADIFDYEKESTTTEELIDIFDYEKELITTEELIDIFDYEKESTTTEELIELFDYEKESTTTEELIELFDYEKESTTTEELIELFDYEKESTTTEELIELFDYEKELITSNLQVGSQMHFLSSVYSDPIVKRRFVIHRARETISIKIIYSFYRYGTFEIVGSEYRLFRYIERFVNLPPFFYRSPEYLIDLPPFLYRPPERLIDFPPFFYRPPERLIDFPPFFYRSPEYLIDLPPVVYRPPEYNIDFPPVVYRPPEYNIDFPPVVYRPPEYNIDFPPLLDQEKYWNMDDLPKSGAYYTYIQLWANDGRNGDQVTSRGKVDPNFDPMVMYKQEYKYAPGAHSTEGGAEDQQIKYVNAKTFQIPLTDYWNYRIILGTRHFAVPRRGRMFPVKWFMRGG